MSETPLGPNNKDRHMSDRLFRELEMKRERSHKKLVNTNSAERDLRKKIEPFVAKILEKPIVISKRAINDQKNRYPISFGRDDEIELKTTVTVNGQIIWFIRNKTLTDKEVKPLPDGELRLITRKDLQEFIQQVDPRRIGVHKLKNILWDTRQHDDRKQIYGFFKEAEGNISGIAYVNASGRNARLTRLAVNPDLSNYGIGSAIIDSLKDKFDNIGVSAVPFGGMNENPREASEKLERFYRNNGFVNGSWSRKTISLEDVGTNQVWQEITEDIFNIGVGQHRISTEQLKRVVFSTVLESPDLRRKLKYEELQKLKEWEEADFERVYLERELDKVNEIIKEERKRS